MLLPQLLKQEGLLRVTMVMLMLMPSDCEGHTTCTAITTVYNTSVTCLFAEDISQHSFNVQFFFPNTSVDPEMPLVCNKLMSGGLTCHKGSQVFFDEKQKIADRFTLSRPPSLNKLNGGYYQCHAVPSLKERSEVCPLTYQEVPKFVPLESLHPPPKDGNDGTQVFMLFAIVILILFIATISAGFYLWLKRNSWFVWCDKPTTGHWSSGAVEGFENSDQRRGRTTKIPDGLPTYFYNLGWNEALKDEKNGKRDPTSSTEEGVPLLASHSDITEDPQASTPMMAGHHGGFESEAGASVEKTQENKAKGKGKGQDVNTGTGEQQGAAAEEQGEMVGKQDSDLKWYQLYKKTERRYSQTMTVLTKEP